MDVHVYGCMYLDDNAVDTVHPYPQANYTVKIENAA